MHIPNSNKTTEGRLIKEARLREVIRGTGYTNRDHAATRRAGQGSCSVPRLPPVSAPTAIRSSATLTHQAGNWHLRNLNRLRGPHAIYHNALDFNAHTNRALCGNGPSTATLASPLAAPPIRFPSMHVGRAPLKLPSERRCKHTPTPLLRPTSTATPACERSG
jgi:hypothetical protein